MSRRLSTFVTVHDESGQAHTFGPGQDLPGWASKAITNPNVWEGASTEAAGSDGPVRPPESGKGSSLDAWQEYALEIGVDFDDDMTRDEIIAAVNEQEAAQQ